MTTLTFAVAVSAALTLTLRARPLVAIPGGLAAALAWMLAATAAADVPHLLLGVGSTASAMCTAAYTLHLGVLVQRRERRRAAARARGERPARWDVAAGMARDEISGGAR